MKQFVIEGYFTKKHCDNLKNKLHGKTMYNWQISYSNWAGNCSLIVGTEYDEEIEKLKQSFIWFVLCELGSER